jgi:5-methylcytosine-specific restriction enzyme A
MIEKLFDFVSGRAPLAANRSSHWPRVRIEHLRGQSRCVVCHGTAKLEVHHIKPFWAFPELELEPSNLLTLCEAKKYGINCHLGVGHLGNYQRINESVIEDAAFWSGKLNNKE